MGLFRPYEQGKGTETDRTEASQGRPSRLRRAPRPADVQPAPEPVQERAPRQGTTPGARGQAPRKKQGRTPTRAEAEAARMARLHPTLSPKEQRKAQREADRTARMRNLDAVERTPERTLLRDHVDSQLTVTEFTIPLMLGIMAVTLGFGRSATVQNATSVAMFALFALWLLNIVLRWRSFKKLATARGLHPRQRGLMMYMVNRMMTLRSLRRPSPRIERGEAY